MNNNYPFAPLNASDNFLKKLVLSINFLMNGKSNNTGALTLTGSTTTTTISNNLCNENSVILLMPMTSHAAQELSHIYISSGFRQFTLTHRNNAQTDKTYRYIVVG